MPTPGKLRSLLRSRRFVVAVAAVAVVGGVAAAASAGGGSRHNETPAGPVATTAVRDLVTTLEASGVIERVDQRTISYAAADAARIANPSGATAGSGGSAGTVASTGSGGSAPSGDTRTTPTTTVTGGTGTTAETGTTGQAGPATTTTTDPATTTTSTTAPASTTTTTAPVTTATTSSGSGDTEDTITLTGVLAVGTEAGRGSVLYTADDEPTVALLGSIPMWRTLEAGVDAGADIRQLEQNLVALGYGSGITVDTSFTAGTAAAVKRWETALGRTDPDGIVAVGEVVYLASAGSVLGHEATVGEPLETGTAILTVGSDEQVLSADVPVDDASGWAPGSTVDLTWADGTTTTGRVSEVSSDVVDGNVAITVGLNDADRRRPTGAEATITAVDVRHAGVVAVPVAAIVAGPDGGRAVRVPDAGAADRLTAVKTGLVAGGWIEITSGLPAGATVRLPG